MNKVRYGIVGVGKQGAVYAHKFDANKDKNAVLTAVCDTDPARRAWCKQSLRGTKVFDNHAEMFSSGLIDAALIVTPHYGHVPIAVDAFKAGLHVLVDKPASVEAAEAERLNAVAAQFPNQKFGIMYNQRTDKLYRTAKRLIDAGELGQLKRIVWIITDWYRPQAYYDQGGWRGTWGGEGGGVLINQCPHQLDLFTWFAGLPKKVRASAKTVGRSIAVENDVTAECEFENGATGVFITSTHDAPGSNRLEITGTRGKITVENRRLTFVQTDTPEPEFSNTNKGFMSAPKTRVITIKKRFCSLIKEHVNPGQHFLLMRNFSRVVLGIEDKLIAPGTEGVIGLTFSNAVHLSAWTGKEITLPFGSNEFKAELDAKIKQECQNAC